MHRTHENSLETYRSILERLPNSRRQVMSAVVSHGKPITRQDLCEVMGRPPNVVTARVRELLDTGELRECGTVKGPEGKPRALLEPVPPDPQGDLF